MSRLVVPAISATRRRYVGLLNSRRKHTGHFWQGRNSRAVMDKDHLAAAFRYVLRNPVEAGMVTAPERWPWSSAAAYQKGRGDGSTDTKPMRSHFPDMRGLLSEDETLLDDLAVHDDQTIGRPRGDAAFIKALEKKSGRSLLPGKRGPKTKAKSDPTENHPRRQKINALSP